MLGMKESLVLALLISVFIFSAYEWNSYGDPEGIIVFEGNEYHQTDEHIVANGFLQYTGAMSSNRKIFVSPKYVHQIYVEDDDDYITYQVLEADIGYNHTISDCLKMRSENLGIEVETIGNSIYLEHTMKYYCCAELELDTIIEEDRITIFVINYGDVCRCLCDYRLSTEIYNLSPGDYHISVCGILTHEYGPQYSDYGVLWQKDITIP